MPARSIGSATISFGLVSIPIRVYVATHSEQLSFNMLHAPCGTRIKQQLYCPHHDKVVERSEIAKGYQFEKDRYVTFTDEELRALEAEANRAIDIHEFVPLAGVDPIYFEDAHYLGPDKGAEKAFHPEEYKDQYRERVQELVQKKVAGEEVTAAEPEKPKAQVIDLMEALKASVARTAARAERVGEPEVAGKRRSAARARAHETPAATRRAHKK